MYVEVQLAEKLYSIVSHSWQQSSTLRSLGVFDQQGATWPVNPDHVPHECRAVLHIGLSVLQQFPHDVHEHQFNLGGGIGTTFLNFVAPLRVYATSVPMTDTVRKIAGSEYGFIVK